MGQQQATTVDETTRSRSGRVARIVRWALVSLPIAILAYTLMLALPGAGRSASAVGRISLVVILVCVACEAGATLTLSQVYGASLRAFGTDLPARSRLNVSMSAFTVSLVVPGGGAVGAVVAARRMMAFGVPGAVATTAVVLMGTTAMVTLAGLVGIGAILSVFSADLSPAYVALTAALGGVLVVLVSLMLVILRSERARDRILGVAERLLARFPVDVAGWRRSLDEMAANPPGGAAFRSIVGWSAINWGFDLVSLWLIFWDLGAPLDLGVLLVGYGMGNLAAALPITPGGLGLLEAGMAGTFAAFGIDTSTAVVGVLAYRVLSYWLPVLAGVVPYLRPPLDGESVT